MKPLFFYRLYFCDNQETIILNYLVKRNLSFPIRLSKRDQYKSKTIKAGPSNHQDSIWLKEANQPRSASGQTSFPSTLVFDAQKIPGLVYPTRKAYGCLSKSQAFSDSPIPQGCYQRGYHPSHIVVRYWIIDSMIMCSF